MKPEIWLPDGLRLTLEGDELAGVYAAADQIRARATTRTGSVDNQREGNRLGYAGEAAICQRFGRRWRQRTRRDPGYDLILGHTVWGVCTRKASQPWLGFQDHKLEQMTAGHCDGFIACKGYVTEVKAVIVPVGIYWLADFYQDRRFETPQSGGLYWAIDWGKLHPFKVLDEAWCRERGSLDIDDIRTE